MNPLAAILDRALAAPVVYHRAVATDADGTLWSVDVGDLLFSTVGRRRDIRTEALATLRRHAAEHLPHVPDDPAELTEALLARYAAGDIPIGPMCTLEAEALGARSTAELSDLLDDVGAAVAETVRPEARALLTDARARGFTVHVVSGSLGAAVEAVLRIAGLPYDTVSGAVLQTVDGHVAPTLAGPIPLFDGKVRALAAAGAWPAALGMGDGGWDVTFLRDVHVPVLMHPKPALEAAMAGHPRAVRVG